MVENKKGIILIIFYKSWCYFVDDVYKVFWDYMWDEFVVLDEREEKLLL